MTASKTTAKPQRVVGLAPFFSPDSRVLILGSFPSVKSREQSFYYGNPRNAFWRILASFFGEDTPQTVEEKKALLVRRGVALWDVVTECDIVGSSDSAIKNFVIANLSEVLQNAPIECILINGSKAFSLFTAHCGDAGLPVIALPSTSPANFKRDDKEWYDALRRAFMRA